MTYTKSTLPPGASENVYALEAAEGYANHLSALGARVQWIRGMQAYSPPDDWYMARADVAVTSPGGDMCQFCSDYISPNADFKNAVFANANDFGHAYRTALWTSAVKSALETAIASAFPHYEIHLNSGLGVEFGYRNGQWVDHNRIPRRMKGFIAGFLAAWEITAPRPDTAQTSPAEPQSRPPTAPPERQP